MPVAKASRDLLQMGKSDMSMSVVEILLVVSELNALLSLLLSRQELSEGKDMLDR